MGATDTEDENDRFLKAAKAADRGQLRTAARPLRGFKLLPPTEATADAIEQLYQTSDAAQKPTDAAFEPFAHVATSHSSTSLHTSVMHSDKRIQDRAESETATSQLSCVSTRSSDADEMSWVQLWADKELDPAFTEPWLQAKVIGGDKGGGEARPIAFRGDAPLKLVTSSILRGHISQVRRAAGSYQYGFYDEGGVQEIS